VNLQPRLVRQRDRQPERIKRRLRGERSRTRFAAALEIRITAAANLHEQRVEAACLRGRDHRGDFRRRTQRGAHDP